VSYAKSLTSIKVPKDKVKVFLILSKVKFNRDNKPDIKMINNLISEYGLKTYQKILDNLILQVNSNNHKNQLRELEKEYLKELIEEHVVKNINVGNYLSEISNKNLIEYSEILGAYLVAIDLKTNQVRKFLDGIRKLENTAKRKSKKEFSNEELILLKVHLAYAAAREKKAKPFMMVINSAIDKVREKGQEGYEDFRKLAKFVEATIAYHKYYGGSE